MVAPIEDYYARYDKEVGDEGLSTMFAKWGRDREQVCRNMRAYDMYRSCGFNEEPKFDRYGWCENNIPKEGIETITLFDDEPLYAKVECVQIPNGKWVGGRHFMLSSSGGAFSVSIWGTQYETRIYCLTAMMQDVAHKIKESVAAKDRKHLEDVVKAIDDVRQLTLF